MGCTGHHMEAMLATTARRALSSDQHKRILNIDIGGVAFASWRWSKWPCHRNRAIHVGGRWWSASSSKIIRLRPGSIMQDEAGFHWHKGDGTWAPRSTRFADYMADALIAAIRMRPLPPPLLALYLTEPIAGHRAH